MRVGEAASLMNSTALEGKSPRNLTVGIITQSGEGGTEIEVRS